MSFVYDNYSIKHEKNLKNKKNFLFNDYYFLYFHLDGKGVEWMDIGLPIPTYLHHANRGYFMGYAIDGFFHTSKNINFLNDIIARFLITFKEYNIKKLDYKPEPKKYSHIFNKVYKLKELQALKSRSNKILKAERADKFYDVTFWAIKFYCEDLIKEQGMATYEQLIEFARVNFYYKNDSTLRCKCRSIWRWYDARDWKIQTKKYDNNFEKYKGTRMTRTENLKNIKKQEEMKNYKKIINLITGLFADEYKKKSGAWHISKISNELGLSRFTVRKHINIYLNSLNSQKNE